MYCIKHQDTLLLEVRSWDREDTNADTLVTLYICSKCQMDEQFEDYEDYDSPMFEKLKDISKRESQ